MLGKTRDTVKQSAIRVARRTPDSVTIQEIFDECTTAHNDLQRNRGFSPWQLLLGNTPTDKPVCENPDLAQCSVEVVDEDAKQRLCVKEKVVQSVHRRGAVTSKTSQRNSSSWTLEALGAACEWCFLLEIWQTQGFESEVVCSLGRHACLSDFPHKHCR